MLPCIYDVYYMLLRNQLYYMQSQHSPDSTPNAMQNTRRIFLQSDNNAVETPRVPIQSFIHALYFQTTALVPLSPVHFAFLLLSTSDVQRLQCGISSALASAILTSSW